MIGETTRGIGWTIQRQWNAFGDKDDTWDDKYLHASFLGWEDPNPLPRKKASIQRWNKYFNGKTDFKAWELSPLGVVMEGRTVVARYNDSLASENNQAERETAQGRFTDVLLKTSPGWRFIAWRGGDAPRWKEKFSSEPSLTFGTHHTAHRRAENVSAGQLSSQMATRGR